MKCVEIFIFLIILLEQQQPQGRTSNTVCSKFDDYLSDNSATTAVNSHLKKSNLATQGDKV